VPWSLWVAADIVVAEMGPAITDRLGESGNLWERQSSALTVATSIASAINLTASGMGAACASAGPAAQPPLTQAWTASAVTARQRHDSA